MNRFKDKVVLVTGGNRNTGLWLVKKFVDEGARVFICGSSVASTQEGYEPKPAFSAYMAFINRRPEGSVQTPAAWHDKSRRYYYPQWTRPDGKKAGIVWCVEGETRRALRFKGGKPVFRNLYGRRIPVLELEDNVFNVPVSESPVYFEGAEITK